MGVKILHPALPYSHTLTLSHSHTLTLDTSLPPSPAKRPVQFHPCIQLSSLNKGQAKLRIQGSLLGCNHFQIIRQIVLK